MNAPDVLLAGRYRLIGRVGTGGMGVVWEAWDERLHRRVAIKQLHAQPGLSDEEAELAKLRAMREARITARLDHPHAVPVFDVVEHDNRPCLIMQFLPSAPLSGVLRERKVLPLKETARVGAQVASALAAAHQLGITHRDVKPGNILVATDGTAKISDFGIAHALGDTTLTATGLVHGTPAYLAPEAARGGESSFASDVFGLGATLYTALEGSPPFGTDLNSIALLHKVASGNFVPPVQSGALTPLLLQMLSSQPEDRPSMRDAAAELTRLAADSGVPEQTLKFAGGASLSQLPVRPEEHSLPKPEEELSLQEWVLPAGSMSSGAGERRPTRLGRRRLFTRATLAIVALLAVAILGMALLPLLDQGDTTATNLPPDGTQSKGQSTRPSNPASASDPPSSAPPSRSTTTSATSPSPDEKPTAPQLAKAIRSYYAIMPDGTDEAWSLMTERYREKHAGGRESYEAFWEDVSRVKVSDVQGDPAGRVEATITYSFSDGRVVKDRTSYTLLRDDDVLKIDSSTVLSSSTG